MNNDDSRSVKISIFSLFASIAGIIIGSVIYASGYGAGFEGMGAMWMGILIPGLVLPVTFIVAFIGLISGEKPIYVPILAMALPVSFLLYKLL